VIRNSDACNRLSSQCNRTANGRNLDHAPWSGKCHAPRQPERNKAQEMRSSDHWAANAVLSGRWLAAPQKYLASSQRSAWTHS
jgi:hypothetical protein